MSLNSIPDIDQARYMFWGDTAAELAALQAAHAAGVTATTLLSGAPYASVTKGRGETVNVIANTDSGGAVLDLSLGTIQDVTLSPWAFADGVTINASPTFTSASANFTDADIGRSVTGTNVPAGTTIIARASATSVTLSKNATASGSALAWTLNRNIVLTITNPSASGKGTDWTLILRQDATGGRYVTFPASLITSPVQDGGVVAANTVSFFKMLSVNAGAAYYAVPIEPFSGFASDLLASGEETAPRETVSSASSQTSQLLRLSFFTARKTEAITQLLVGTGGTAAGATPTLCRIGIYWENPVTGDLVLVASIANDTTLFGSANVSYSRSLTATFNKVKGQRYATGTLVVTAATAPTLMGLVGAASAIMSSMSTKAPRMTASVAGQADLPANILASSLATGSGGYQYVEMIP